jgi:hypothetical protein
VSAPGITTNWLPALRRYLGVSLVGHFMWENLQLPLYTLWTTGTFGQKAFAVVHCTIGDGMIASLTVLIALALFGHALWPRAHAARVCAVTVGLGSAYTFYSEWMNTSVRGSWAYSDLMPIVPVAGTGLSPLLQWIVVPALALGFATGGVPWKDQGANVRT